MKRINLRYTAITLTAILAGVVIATAVTTNAEADEYLDHVDAFIESHQTETHEEEPETVSLSYADWQEIKSAENDILIAETVQNVQISSLNVAEMDVWTLGEYLYGISELDTTRMLKLITIEGYTEDPTLDYYCACACVTRVLNGYFGAGDVYSAFGGADQWYSTLVWDEEWYGIDEHAYGALRDALLNYQYIDQCNGVTVPDEYIYYSDVYGIYAWN